MRFSLSRWLRPEMSECTVCGRMADARSNAVPVPVRHPAAREILQQLCMGCRSSIPWIGAPVCRYCGRPEFCPDCPRRQDKQMAFCRCAVRYDDRMRDMLALYKYRGSERLEPVLAAMLAAAFERVCSELGGRDAAHIFQAVTAVPLAEERLDDRGFNQAERMAVSLSQWYGVAYLPLLQRVRHTEKQSLKTRRSRIVDMKGNFVADRDVMGRIPFAGVSRFRILLIDDIYTTGSTVNECARALKDALAEAGVASEPEVYGALWARS
ncbi:ComF family protein [Cohnella pontilimi]|uniref:ComF family protein n=1 Tax=Cohnella pontilimi TaxID=2564100 RepID=A0A4U0FAV0_9BACL|nr:ComF family protein [Cohnella pontilimi]TJY41943.1 ComF family protein [Cohnella pontilimi]